MVSLAERAPSGCPGSLIEPATFVRSKSWVLNITCRYPVSELTPKMPGPVASADQNAPHDWGGGPQCPSGTHTPNP